MLIQPGLSSYCQMTKWLKNKLRLVEQIAYFAWRIYEQGTIVLDVDSMTQIKQKAVSNVGLKIVLS